MTEEMYEDLLERARLQISELNTLTEEQDKHICKLIEENAGLKARLNVINLLTSEKENRDLKVQIEKMKCCGNCIGSCNSDDLTRFHKKED